VLVLVDEGPDVIDAMQVVGMGVRQHHGVKIGRTDCDHLAAEIRSRIDDHRGLVAIVIELFDQNRCPSAAVLRVRGIAIAPVARDPRHTGGRAAAQNGEAAFSHQTASLGIFEKQRKAFSVVMSAISSSPTPIVSARTCAVLTT